MARSFALEMSMRTWVWIGQQAANTEQHLGDRQCWRPLILQDIQADTTAGVDVGMVAASSELHPRWLEGVVGRELDVQEKDATGEWLQHIKKGKEQASEDR